MSSPFPFHGIFSSLGQEQVAAREKQTQPFSDGSMPLPAFQDAPSAAYAGTTGQVAVDVFEQDDYYIIRAPIAGVKLQDLDIDIDDNTITIRGNRQPGDAIPSDQYYVQECFFGPFQRKVTLPCKVNPRTVKATFNKECILKILIPKEERVKIVRISEG